MMVTVLVAPLRMKTRFACAKNSKSKQKLGSVTANYMKKSMKEKDNLERAVCIVKQDEFYFFIKRTKDPFNGKINALSCKVKDGEFANKAIKILLEQTLNIPVESELLNYEGKLLSKEDGEVYNTVHLFSYEIPPKSDFFKGNSAIDTLAIVDHQWIMDPDNTCLLVPNIPILVSNFFKGQIRNYVIDYNENFEIVKFSWSKS
jgi:hypothetical protein